MVISAINIKRLIIIMLTWFYVIQPFSEAYSQIGYKPVIDANALSGWKAVYTPAISNNGSYAAYIVDKGYTSNVLILKSVEGCWQKEIPEVRTYQFNDDNTKAFILTKSGKLIILKLGTDHIRAFDGISSYKLFVSNNEWLSFHKKGHSLVLLNLSSQKEYCFNDISLFYQSSDFKKLLLISDKNGDQELSYIEFPEVKRRYISHYKGISEVLISDDGSKAVFDEVNISSNSTSKRVWIYSFANKKPRLLIDNKHLANDSFLLESLDRISTDGKWIFGQAKKITQKMNESDSKIDIWKYSDVKLLSQTKKTGGDRTYLFRINAINGAFEVIEKEFEHSTFLNDGDRFIGIIKREGDMSEEHWNPQARAVNYIFSVATGDRTPIPIDPIGLSPNQKYIIGFSEPTKGLKLFDTSKRIAIDITAGIIKNFKYQGNLALEDREQCAFAGWFNENVLIYDNYDIWEVDPKNPKNPINLTAGQGRQTNMSFRFAFAPESSIYNPKDMELLNAFDYQEKRNGFYSLKVSKLGSKPAELIMRDWFLNVKGLLLPADKEPMKARDKNLWMLKIEMRNKSANYFLTPDFKNFKFISDEHSEDNYLWYKADLVNFKTANGELAQAIMYKPEDFDSTKRYPVLLNYYEKFSNNLNRFRRPELTSDAINIPWFVARGYIVCTPDIIYKSGEPGLSCVSALEGLASKLSSFPYIDSCKIGIQGHSFGGYETIFTVTHSDRFAAAMASCGYSDLIYDVLSVKPGSGINFSAWRSEKGQGRMGCSLWGNPEIYLENSPVLYANRVRTPMLMMNNDRDGIIDFSQGLEFFIALRQLGKPVWLINYKGEDHGLNNPLYKINFTQKLEEYFGYYLKGAPMPDWMKPKKD
jgi:dipeptidyl aminopeptidase/acylaminoacyl peptidase